MQPASVSASQQGRDQFSLLLPLGIGSLPDERAFGGKGIELDMATRREEEEEEGEEGGGGGGR